MDIDTVRARLEEIGLKDDQIEEILPLLAAEEAKPADNSGLRSSLLDIHLAMQNEGDWRKRAALAAKIISLSTEE